MATGPPTNTLPPMTGQSPAVGLPGGIFAHVDVHIPVHRSAVSEVLHTGESPPPGIIQFHQMTRPVVPAPAVVVGGG